MRQVVNGAKGRPLLGHSALSMRSDEEDDHDEGYASVLASSAKTGGSRQQVERERRLRREIANSNERRRMQSINQGYNSLKAMLPLPDGGEKLSKAAVLQHAAEYMAQVLDERKQLLIKNSELTQIVNDRRLQEDAPAAAKKRKKCDTESSDEGISLSYHPHAAENELLEEMRRNVTELRIQLERERQRCTFLEQSYTYSLMAAQVSQQPPVTSLSSTQQAPAVTSQSTMEGILSPPHVLPPNQLPPSPPQSRHTSTDEQLATGNPLQRSHIDRTDVCRVQTEVIPVSQPQSQQCFGKASSVASQNLSIIVEAINHLEGDQRHPNQLKVNDIGVDSGVSHGESSDDTKSECSRTNTPQPPPAHQSLTTLTTRSHHTGIPTGIASHHAGIPTGIPASHHVLSPASSLYASVSTYKQGSTSVESSCMSPPTQTAPVPLVYRPTFLSNYLPPQQQQQLYSGSGPQLDFVPQANNDSVAKANTAHL